jgi:hypothetical protein
MKRLLVVTLFLVAGCYSFDTETPRGPARAELETGSTVEFSDLAPVFQHPRCANCHPGKESPLQRDGRMHNPPVRGFATADKPATDCSLCHQTSWNPQTRIPGAPHWELAPKSMHWAGQSDREICEQIKDPERNGGMTLDEVREHLANDELVAWGWDPGPGLEPAPGSAESFAAAFKEWVEDGAECP